MSSNEIANHIEAACWLKFGPGDPGVVPPPLYFRSQNGFIDRIGVADVNDPTAAPVVMLELDRYYTRSETAVFVSCPQGVDIAEIPPDPPEVVFYPDPGDIQGLLAPNFLCVDSRAFYNELNPFPATPEEFVMLFERYNAIFIQVPAVTGEGVSSVFTDLCVQVLRIPRGSNGPGTVTYKQLEGGF